MDQRLSTTLSIPCPHEAQRRVLNEARRFNVLECGRRWGKTQLGLGLASETSLDGAPFGWFAPTYKYFSEAWDELLEVLGPMVESKDKAAGRIKLKTGGGIDVWSLHDNPHAGRGRKYKRVFVDEAAIVRRLMHVWQNAIRPTLTDMQGEAWFGSTPYGHNDFHTLFEVGQQGDPEWMSWRMGTVTNPHISPEEVEAARNALPEVVFEQEYLGIPAPDGGNPFGLDHINACVVEGGDRARGDRGAAAGGGQPVAYGVDLAKSQDWTVVIGLDDHGRTVAFERWQRVPWDETKRRIARLIGQSPAMVDATGVGDPIVESLIREHDCTGVEPFVFTSTSKQRIMEGLADAIQSRAVSFPDGDIVRELKTFRYELMPGGRTKYEAAAGLHDDCVCAMALAHEMKRRYVPIQVIGAPEATDEYAGMSFAERRSRDVNFGFGDN